MKVVYVAAAALINQDGLILLAQRPPGKAMAGLWEFPGGKIEPDETPEAALVRELREELAVEHTSVSASGLAALRGHASLEGLYVKGTKVTKTCLAVPKTN